MNEFQRDPRMCPLFLNDSRTPSPPSDPPIPRLFHPFCPKRSKWNGMSPCAPCSSALRFFHSRYTSAVIIQGPAHITIFTIFRVCKRSTIFWAGRVTNLSNGLNHCDTRNINISAHAEVSESTSLLDGYLQNLDRNRLQLVQCPRPTFWM